MSDFDKEQAIKIQDIIYNLKENFKDNIYVEKINRINFVEIKFKNKIIIQYNQELHEAFKESMLTSIEEDNGDIMLGFQFFE